jgi:hypothetical protein
MMITASNEPAAVDVYISFFFFWFFWLSIAEIGLLACIHRF